MISASIGGNDWYYSEKWDAVFYIVSSLLTLVLLIVILFVIILRRFYGLTKIIHIIVSMLDIFLSFLHRMVGPCVP